MTQTVLPWAFCPLVADRGCASVLGHRASWPVMKSTGFRVRKSVSRAVSLLSLAVRSLANLSQARFLLPPHLRPASPCTPQPCLDNCRALPAWLPSHRIISPPSCLNNQQICSGHFHMERPQGTSWQEEKGLARGGSLPCQALCLAPHPVR